MPAASSTCPACGQPASGRFCPACGAALGARPCAGCGAPLAAGARFCASCGTAAAGAPGPNPGAAGPGGSRSVLPFVVAGLAIVVALVAFLMPREPAVGGGAGAPLAAVPEAPPLLDGLAPRDRFDTLYNRSMRASERGDDMTVAQYAPQALQAYRDLGVVDADARYHAAMLRLHTGDAGGALALADTILQAEPTHLFGYVIRGTVARLQGDTAARTTAVAAFREHFPAESGAGRPEYGHHGFILNQFREEAGIP